MDKSSRLRIGAASLALALGLASFGSGALADVGPQEGGSKEGALSCSPAKVTVKGSQRQNYTTMRIIVGSTTLYEGTAYTRVVRSTSVSNRWVVYSSTLDSTNTYAYCS